MYSTLNLGPVALPTGPLSALLAAWLAIELAARMGQRHDLDYDDMLGMFILALGAGIIASRLWHVFSYWSAYRTHLSDILALRPAGLPPWPGYVCAFITAYGFMLVRRLDPVAAGAATLTGLVGGGTIYFLGSFLSGRLIGTVSEAPWALPYGDTLRHPTALYLALGCLFIWLLLWYRDSEARRTLFTGVFLSALLLLITEAFTLYRWYSPGIRWPQVGYLLAAVASATALARTYQASVPPSPSVQDAVPHDQDSH